MKKHTHKTQNSFLKRAALLPSRALTRFLLVVVHAHKKRSPRAALFYIKRVGARATRGGRRRAAESCCLFFFLTGVGRPSKTENVNFSTQNHSTQNHLLLRVFFFNLVSKGRERAEREGKNRKKRTHSHAHYM